MRQTRPITPRWRWWKSVVILATVCVGAPLLLDRSTLFAHERHNGGPDQASNGVSSFLDQAHAAKRTASKHQVAGALSKAVESCRPDV